jgi:CBS domain containing-hemolysin-like protein
MEKYLLEHIKLMEEVLSSGRNTAKLANWLTYNRVQIGFLQHERLIHLLVTLFCALVLVILLLASIFYYSICLLIADSLLAILVIFYLRHYYVLENGVQKLYRLDQQLEKQCSTAV